MKKVLVAGAALMLAAGMYASASAAEVKPGVVITGDARARLAYKSNAYDFDDSDNDNSQVNMDSRVRINFTGTAAGGSYAKVRIRVMEGVMGDSDTDSVAFTNNNNNLWADQAYMGVPFTDQFTLEVGKYRSTYGPLGTTYNFFYDDVNLTGGRAIIKMGNIEINPFIEWMDEAQNANTYISSTGTDVVMDNDEIRYGAHLKAKINKDWTAGGMLGYQNDDRVESAAGQYTLTSINANDGFFGSVYVNGKSGAFGLVGELAVTESDLNGFNSWFDDSNAISLTTTPTDLIGSDDTGFGGYVFPNFQIDKLNIGLNLGFTTGGFMPDRAFGFVMIGGTDNSWITATQIGATGDWMWAGLVATYAINDSLKLTGNFVYADIDAWTNAGDGPGFTGAANSIALESAWELSAVLQYTISKGADVYFSAGYLNPSREYVYQAGSPTDDAAFGALTRFELKF